MHSCSLVGLFAFVALAAACSGGDSSPAVTPGPGAGGSAGNAGSAGATTEGGSGGGGGSAGSGSGGTSGTNASGTSSSGGTSSSAGAGQGEGGGSGQAGAGNVGGSGPVAGGGGSWGQGGAPLPDVCSTEEECVAFKTPAGQGVPPGKAGGGEANGPETLTHAVSKWFLGETNRKDEYDAQAWRDFGFDLDGWSSTAQQGFHCSPAAGAKASETRLDGNHGIDNSFSRNIINGLLSTLIAAPSKDWSTQVVSGHESKLLDLGKLGSAASYDAAPSKVLWVLGQKSGSAPVAPPSEDWSGYAWNPVTGTPSTTTDLPGAYLAGNTWVSGEAPMLEVRIAFEGFSWAIPVRKARMTLDLTDRKRGVSGNLGGLILTEDAVTSFVKLAGNFGSSLCGDSSALDGISEWIRQSSDILQDGTQDPAKECNAISIGLGFETKASKLGSGASAPVASDPCPD